MGYGVSSKVSYEYSSITTDNKPPYNTIGEEGKVPATYYRTTFNIDDMNMVKKVSGLIDYDDAAYIYVNGVLRVKAGGFKADYKNRDFDIYPLTISSSLVKLSPITKLTKHITSR